MAREGIRLVEVGYRLQAKLKKTRSGCHEWQGHRDEKGYGKIRVDSSTIDRTHRVALRLSGVPVNKGDFVLHACDNPPCCNPEHLSVGTVQDNVRDMVGKGRQKGASGSANRAAKLTERKVRNIRERYTNLTPQEIAKKYGVSPQTIRRVLTGDSWN